MKGHWRILRGEKNPRKKDYTGRMHTGRMHTAKGSVEEDCQGAEDS